MINETLIAVFFVVGGILTFALHRKDRVKANLNFLGAAFSFEAEGDKRTGRKRISGKSLISGSTAKSKDSL